MADTKKMIALHRITLKPDGKKEKIIEPHPVKTFDCPVDDIEYLKDAGAIMEPTDENSRIEVVEADGDETVVSGASGADSTEDDAETERLELLAKAKGMKIKGIRKDMAADTLREKITEAEAEAAKAAEAEAEKSDDETVEDVL